jgi:hypothetical protein
MSESRGRAATIGLVVGYAVMGVGVVGILRALPLRTTSQVAIWVVGADLLHDVLIAPFVCLVGFGLARVVAAPWRWPVRGGVMGTAVVLVVAYPALRGFGRTTAPGNDSVLPLDYASATLTVVTVVWVLAAAWGVANVIAERRRRPARP